METAPLEQSTFVTPKGEVRIALQYYEATTKNIVAFKIENVAEVNVHAQIFVDGVLEDSYAGKESAVLKSFTPVQAVEVTLEGETFYEPPANFRYAFRVLE